ncbi:MAG: S9 family peptidase [Theionarchaea archaeon]|nr:MAG: hypothetical protein AYK18_12990 [Theionarchaea archaeon DG-70]MBU7009596.1 S9 family peptidase [Theionarchaea archaeon]
MQKKRSITAEDLYNFRLISDCQISPDGRHIIFSVQRVDKETEKKYSNLWIVPTDGGPAKQFTHGNQKDTHPRWAPEGSKIAFLSNRDDEKQAQIYLIPLAGGEARRLTDLKGTFEGFEWSPNGSQLVSTFRKKDEEELEREENEQKKELGVVYRHITRVFYKEDGEGFLPKERFHLWVIDVSTGEATQVTDSDIYDETEPCWAPDGKEIVFCSNRTEDPDLDPDAIDLYIVPAAGGEFREIETPAGPKRAPQFSPDGKWVAYLGSEGKGLGWKLNSLWVVPADGSESARNLTEQFDVETFAVTINDMPGVLPTTHPIWLNDGREIYFQVSHHGNTVLKSLAVQDNSLEPVIDTGVAGLVTFDDAQSVMAYLHADMKIPGEIWVRDRASGESRQLTHMNEQLLQTIELGSVEEVWFPGAEGYHLQGWIITPPHFDKTKTYPSILEIHGGPRVQYGNFFMHEFFFLAAQGYIIYFCNPRGSRGYGEEHSKAIVNNWGTLDYEDLMALTDYMEKKPYIDKERMGVTGGSYGGYMTNWIIGHTDRFKAAVTQRSVSNWTSMYGSSDLNWSFQPEFGDEPPWKNIDNWWRQSPIKYIENAKTPTLVIHSEQDLRADVEQGLQVFVALKRSGVETELLLFPDEPHGLSRTGRTDRRIVRLTYMKQWFDRYLKNTS